MNRCFVSGVLLSAALLLGRVAPGAAAEDDLSATVLQGESLGLARRLEGADRLAVQGKWSEALNEYQHIITEGGDALVPVDLGRRQWVQARWMGQVRLTKLGIRFPAALRLYRSRVDDQARQWLQQGAAAHDRGLLRRIVEEAFCSRPAQDALELLGDLAFERGHLDEARRWWQMLVPPLPVDPSHPHKNADSPDLIYPDPPPECVARVRAKQLLIRLFQGEVYGLESDLRTYKALHGQAAGPLAGTNGNYAALLQKMIDQHRKGPSFLDDDSWTTFAGTSARNLVQTRPLVANDWQWSVRLDTGVVTKPTGTGADLTPSGSRSAQSLAFYPVLTGNLVLWADARFVNAHDLLTGRRVFRYDLLKDGKLDDGVLTGVDLHLPAPAGLRYTLTVAGERAYVRLGAQGLSPPRAAREGPINREREIPTEKRNSYLVCLDLRPEVPQRQVWAVASRQVENDPALFFEGAPVVQDGRAYIVASQLEEAVTRNWIACHDGESGQLLWKREVCTTKAAKEVLADPRRYSHHLLTLAGTTLVYCSHAGAIVALDARTGRHVWSLRYESRGPQTRDGDPSPRDLAPCVYSGGRLFVAPRDTERLLCLDAESGRLVWDREGLAIVHLLGVAEGRLVFTTRSGIRALAATTGIDKGGWIQPVDGGRLPSFGRGFLAGGWVYWPTADPDLSLRALSLADGEPERDGEQLTKERFLRIKGGNLVFSNGCLLVAGTESLHVYVPEERYLPERRAKAAQPNAPAAAFYRLALAEIGTGQYSSALDHLARAEKGQEILRGTAVRILARQRRQQLYGELAEQCQAERKWYEADRWYTQAAEPGFPAPSRVDTLVARAMMWENARQPARAVIAWQALLDDPLLAKGTMNRLREKPERVGTLAAGRIRQLILQHPSAYEPIEKKAQELRSSAHGAARIDILEQLARQYPNARVTGPAVLELATEHEKANHPALAVRAYRHLLGWTNEAGLPPEALAHARAGLDRLQKAAKPREDGPCPDLTLPLVRAWPVEDSPKGKPPLAGRLLVPEGRPCSRPAKDFFLLVGGTEPNLSLGCRAVADSGLRWETRLTEQPTWATCRHEAIVVGGPQRILCLSLKDGQVLWEFQAPPFPAVLQGKSYEDPSLAAFQPAGDGLFFLQGQCRLFALDAETGRIRWSYWAPAAGIRPLYPAGRFNPYYHAGEHWVVVQTGSGRRQVLDSQTGHLLREAEGRLDWWRCPPLPFGERALVMAVASGRVVLFDPVAGKELWSGPGTLTAATSVSSGEPARLWGNQKAVLVLLARNYGYQLERLDPRTGVPLWKPGDRLLRESLTAGQLALDQDGVYYATRRMLNARSLADGSCRWFATLPAGAASWRVACCGSWIMVYPTASGRRRFQDPGFSVLFFEARSGQMVQRLNFSGNRERTVQIGANRLIVGTGGQVWGLKDLE